MKKNRKDCGCACGADRGRLEKPAEALMALAILAVSTDGGLQKEEIRSLDILAGASPLFKGIRKPREYMGCVSSAITGRGRDEVIKEAASLLSPKLRETAYAWAAYMVASDGRQVSAEHRLLSVLRRELGLHGVLAGKINAVASMLHRCK